MLLWTSLLCLFSATIVASEFIPAILASYDPGSTFKPLKNTLDPSDNPHVIRGLLMVRQTNCPTGYMECTNVPGECCPTGGVCCAGGCCKPGSFCYSTGCCPNGDSGCQGNSCCSPNQTCCTGGGCCDPGYYCIVVSGQPGCCQNGSTCNNTPQCTNPGYVLCPGENFCCPAGYQCFRDSSNTPQCSLSSSGVPSSGGPSTLTGTGTQSLPSVTFVQPSTNSIPRGPSTTVFSVFSTTTPQGPSTIVVSTSTHIPTSNNGGTGAASSALSVGVDVLLSLFAGVGAFALLF